MTKQTMFDSDGSIKAELGGLNYEKNKQKQKNDDELRTLSAIAATCPWCLHRATRDRFVEFTQDGLIGKTFKCPECGQGMKESTMGKVDLGPTKYSEWFWEQVVAFKRRDAVSWEKLKIRVKQMGFNSEFWDAYKRIKASHGQKAQ